MTPLRAHSIDITFDSVTLGSRTEYFEDLTYLTYNPTGNLFTVRIRADNGGGSDPLPPGDGEVLRIYVRTHPQAIGGLQNLIDTMSTSTYSVSVKATVAEYTPRVISGSVGTTWVVRGDANNDSAVDLSDLIFMVNTLYMGGPEAITLQHADANADLQRDLSDLIYMVNYLFLGGPPPPTP